jgi:hypothetical protein
MIGDRERWRHFWQSRISVPRAAPTAVGEHEGQSSTHMGGFHCYGFQPVGMFDCPLESPYMRRTSEMPKLGNMCEIPTLKRKHLT